MTAKTEAPAEGGSGERQETAHSGQTALLKTSTSRFLTEAAAAYARLGYVPVPLSKDRRPILRGWPNAEAGEDAARERLERCRACGMALVTNGFVVLDLDRNHADGVDGVASFAALVEAHGGDFPPEGPRVRSRRGGVHIYLAAPVDVDVRSSASRIAPGVDIRAGCALATCPPTPGYSWFSPLTPLSDLPPAPGWLIRLACPPRQPPRALPFQPIQDERYSKAIFQGELNAVAMAPKGQRNAVLFKAAARLGELVGTGMLSSDLAASGLLHAAHACGLVSDDGRFAAEGTIASGLRRGMSNRSPSIRGPRHGS
jgi:hypothetical protein